MYNKFWGDFMGKKLFVFDFDGTIVSGHTHNAIINAKRKAANPENVDAWETVKNFPIIGAPRDWKNIFEILKQQEHYVTIASFNAYPEIIPKFLEEKVGLEKDFINKIIMKVKFPADPQKATKNEYIQEASDDFIKESGEKKDFSGDPKDIILIDDSKKNIKAAREKGYQVIHAEKDASHLTELQKKLLPIVAKPKQLSESELIEHEIKKLEKQREALEKQRKDYLEEINIYSNNQTILFNDPKLQKFDLTDKEIYDQLLNAKRQQSKLQSQAPVEDSKKKFSESISRPTDEQAAVSTEVTEQSVDLPQAKQLKQEIEKFRNLQKKNIETILQLSGKKNLSREENSTLSSLKSDLPGITLAIQAKEEYLGKIEKRDALVAYHHIKSEPVETNSENQGAVPKKPNSVKPVSEPTQQQKKLEEFKKQKELEDLLKAKPKKDKLLEKSSEEKPGAVSTKQLAFLNELKAKQAMQGTSTFFGSGNSSADNKTKTPEKTARKQFSR
ncbi:hypothetical protein FQR65_LT05127 [Abscondita terminalis]|nr:hypothetical protein FQR65_LT05127 [Abscondita terminalis]